MLKLRLEKANTKHDSPFVYNGEPNFTLYQKWVLEAKDWLKHSYIQRKHRVARLKKYLAGCAFMFFMREKYLAFTQRGHPVRNYWRDLEELANSVGRISSHDLAIRFWQGADKYLRVKWAENGFDPELSSLDELEGTAKQYECASKLRHAEDTHRDDKTQRHDTS
jgi:hypothetical protein